MSFSSKLDSAPEDIISDINMTPLVDVMLVLLIIFMVTVPVLTHAVRIELPRATIQENIVKPETVTLSIDRDAKVHWNGTVIDTPDLQQRLATAAMQTPQPEVHIRGDRAVGYEHVLRVMAAVQKAGLSKLGFVSEPQS